MKLVNFLTSWLFHLIDCNDDGPSLSEAVIIFIVAVIAIKRRISRRNGPLGGLKKSSTQKIEKATFGLDKWHFVKKLLTI